MYNLNQFWLGTGVRGTKHLLPTYLPTRQVIFNERSGFKFWSFIFLNNSGKNNRIYFSRVFSKNRWYHVFWISTMQFTCVSLWLLTRNHNICTSFNILGFNLTAMYSLDLKQCHLNRKKKTHKPHKTYSTPCMYRCESNFVYLFVYSSALLSRFNTFYVTK